MGSLYQSDNKDFRKFCNSLRCKVCGGLLDGNINPIISYLYCSENNTHYTISVIPEDICINELIVLTWHPMQYSIDYIQDNIKETKIYQADLNIRKNRLEPVYTLLCEFNGRLNFIHKNMSKEDFLRKLKNYIIFQ